MRIAAIARQLQVATLALLATISAPGEHAAASAVHLIRPADMRWQSIAGYPAGYERAMLEGQPDSGVPVTYRVRLPAGFRFKPHTHTWDEHVTVLKGTWYVGFGKSFDESHMEKLEAGSFVIIPGGMPHYVMVRDQETILQVHGVGPVGLTFITPSDVQP